MGDVDVGGVVGIGEVAQQRRSRTVEDRSRGQEAAAVVRRLQDDIPESYH